jgi:hypothetical protein
MDTPKIPAPRDEGEKRILAELVSLRDQLLLRKLDRTTYVRTQDVMGLYEKTLDQVRQLNELRRGHKREENQGDYKHRATPLAFRMRLADLTFPIT